VYGRIRAAHDSSCALPAPNLAGSAIEWFDYFLYGIVSALVFNKLFFPNFDPVVG
jgi:hypothetical protein